MSAPKAILSIAGLVAYYAVPVYLFGSKGAAAAHMGFLVVILYFFLRYFPPFPKNLR